MKLVKKAKRGFTLVELVVVIAVIAILAAVSVGAYFGVTESANNSRLEQETKQMYTAIQTIALGTSSNQSLGKDGLTVADIDKFERELEASTGQEYEVLTSKPNLLSRTTIVLSTGEFQAVNGASILYKTFEYYNPEISGKKVIASTINGDFKIEKIDSIPVDYGAEDVTNNLVHVVNEAGWSDVYVYAWREIDEVKNANWPGVPMVNLGGNIYAYYLTSTFDKVIFNNNSGAQSPDLDVPTGDEPNYYNNSTKAWGNEPSGEVVVPEIEYKDIYYASYWENPKIHAWAEDSSLGYFDADMELVSDNLYKVSVPVTYDKGLIFTNSTGKLQTSDVLFTGYNSENSKVLWNGSEWTTTSNLPTFELRTMYAILSEDYTTPYIHTWGNDSRYKVNWPGLAMVKVENNDYNIWSYSFIDAPTNMKINSNASDPQTGDLSFGWTAEKPYYDLAQDAWISVPGETPDPGETPEPEPETPTFSEEVFTVTFENKWLWTEVSIHYWKGQDNNGWPGEAMELSDTKYSEYDFYTFEVPVDAEGYIISGIKNEDGTTRDQSPNIESTNSNFNNENGYWYMNWNEGNEVIFVCFPESHIYEGATGYCTLCNHPCNHAGSEETICPTCGFVRPDPNVKKLYIYNDANWETVNFYNFGASGSNASWPGKTLSDPDDDKIFEIDINIAEKPTFIINNGSTQSNDLNYNYFVTNENNCIRTSDFSFKTLETKDEAFGKLELRGVFYNKEFWDKGIEIFNNTITLNLTTSDKFKVVENNNWKGYTDVVDGSKQYVTQADNDGNIKVKADGNYTISYSSGKISITKNN